VQDALDLSTSLVSTNTSTDVVTCFSSEDLQFLIKTFYKPINPYEPLPALAGKVEAAGVSGLLNLRLEDFIIQWDKRVGAGAFAQVFYGVYDGQDVAVKILHVLGGEGDVMRAGVLGEVAANRFLATSGSGLVECYGAAYLPPTHLCAEDCPHCPSTGPVCRVALVNKFCVNGTVRDLIPRVRLLEAHQLKVYYVLVARIIAQLAGALQGLHGQQLLHRDGKGHNFLLDVAEGGLLKAFVGDLGLVAGVGSVATTAFEAGTVEYAAGEVSFT
jgi:serine/threonine protein kinase